MFRFFMLLIKNKEQYLLYNRSQSLFSFIFSVVKVLLKYNADVNSVSDTGQYFINALFNIG